MKYIIFDTGSGLEIPVIFPELLSHLQVRQAFRGYEPVGAGFITAGPDALLYCHGQSVGLGIASRGEFDTRVVTNSFKFEG